MISICILLLLISVCTLHGYVSKCKPTISRYNIATLSKRCYNIVSRASSTALHISDSDDNSNEYDEDEGDGTNYDDDFDIYEYTPDIDKLGTVLFLPSSTSSSSSSDVSTILSTERLDRLVIKLAVSRVQQRLSIEGKDSSVQWLIEQYKEHFYYQQKDKTREEYEAFISFVLSSERTNEVIVPSSIGYRLSHER